MTSAAPASAWTPLRDRLYRGLWFAGLISNVGSAMHGVAAGWVVTSLSTSASVVALLSAAGALPLFLLALPSGALADVFDRRRLLLIAQGIQLAAAAVLGLLDLTNQLAIGSLLGLSVVLGIGAAVNMPNWVALAPEVLPREQLASAGALNAISMNLAGALGPALGGVLIAIGGTGWVFVANAVSFLAVVAVVSRWRRDVAPSGLPAEHVTAAVRTGFRYAANERTLQLLLLRIVCIAIPVTALAALLPMVARQQVGVSSSAFGLMGACSGLSAVGVASVMPKLRQRIGPDGVALAGAITTAVGLALVAAAGNLVMLILGASVASAGQIAMFSTVFSIVQINLPAWVRGRGLATAMFTFQGSFVLGSLVWGALASRTSLSTVLVVAAITAVVLAVAVLPIRLTRFAESDRTPRPLGPLHSDLDVHPDDGPVLVTLRWTIDPNERSEFATAMHRIRRLRRRDGAVHWGLFELVDAPGSFVEQFMVATWAEHERQHLRPTAADDEINQAAIRFRIDEVALHADHHVSAARHGHRHRPSLHDLVHHLHHAFHRH